jgi:hypothetical protein
MEMDEYTETLARLLLCLKCLDHDEDFEFEVMAALDSMAPFQRRFAIHIIEADRESPDEFKTCMEQWRIDKRYDFALEAFGRRPVLALV